MKPAIIAAFFTACASLAQAGEEILPYSAFGPQVAASKLIGMEWWQWDAQGDSQPREYPIKVVVFWDQGREDVVRKYPVRKSKSQDFRYVEYSRAVGYLKRTIQAFREANLDPSTLEETLARLEKIHLK